MHVYKWGFLQNKDLTFTNQDTIPKWFKHILFFVRNKNVILQYENKKCNNTFIMYLIFIIKTLSNLYITKNKIINMTIKQVLICIDKFIKTSCLLHTK